MPFFTQNMFKKTKHPEPLVEGWVLPVRTQGPHAVPRALDAGDSYVGRLSFQLSKFDVQLSTQIRRKKKHTSYLLKYSCSEQTSRKQRPLHSSGRPPLGFPGRFNA